MDGLSKLLLSAGPDTGGRGGGCGEGRHRGCCFESHPETPTAPFWTAWARSVSSQSCSGHRGAASSAIGAGPKPSHLRLARGRRSATPLRGVQRPLPSGDRGRPGRVPEPVQRWLRWSNVLGTPYPVSVRLTQEGQFRMGEDKGWMPFRAQKYYTTDPPGYVWIDG
jgi:hypothetical protein